MNKVLYAILTVLIYINAGFDVVALVDINHSRPYDIIVSGIVANLCGYVIYRKKYRKHRKLRLQKYGNDHIMFRACQFTGIFAILVWMGFNLVISGNMPVKTFASISGLTFIVWLIVPSPLKIVTSFQDKYFYKHLQNKNK